MSAAAPVPLGRRGRWVLGLTGAAILAVFTVANVHLVRVALATQPDCVPHLKAPDPGGTGFRAARSSC